ncbi:MAG: hypothetical protein ACREHD_06755 [Pirellulales bacterium]
MKLVEGRQCSAGILDAAGFLNELPDVLDLLGGEPAVSILVGAAGLGFVIVRRVLHLRSLFRESA